MVSCIYSKERGKIKNENKRIYRKIEEVKDWSKERGLDKADSDKQFIKLAEEFGELAQGLAQGIAKSNREQIIDRKGKIDL